VRARIGATPGVLESSGAPEVRETSIDTGLHYFNTPSFEAGSVVAFGINEQTRGVFVNVGFGVPS
jgi:hypothetical protein